MEARMGEREAQETERKGLKREVAGKQRIEQDKSTVLKHN